MKKNYKRNVIAQLKFLYKKLHNSVDFIKTINTILKRVLHANIGKINE